MPARTPAQPLRAHAHVHAAVRDAAARCRPAAAPPPPPPPCHRSRRRCHSPCILSSRPRILTGYTLLFTAFNAFGFYQLWEDAPNRPGRNWRNIGIGVGGYLVPLLWRGDFHNLGAAVLSFGAAGLTFVTYPFGGWRSVAPPAHARACSTQAAAMCQGWMGRRRSMP